MCIRLTQYEMYVKKKMQYEFNYFKKDFTWWADKI